MPSCFVCNRSRTPLTKLQNITFHRFPADLKIREKWYHFVKDNSLDVKNITKHSLICSCHFQMCSFITNKNCRTLLKTAVPSITISRVKNAKDVFPEKKFTTPILDENKSIVKISNSRIDSEITSDEEFPLLDVSMKSNVSRPNSPTSCNIEDRSIQVSAKNINCEGVSLLDDSLLSNSSLNTTVEDKRDHSFLATSSVIALDDTPRRRCLKLGVNKLSKQMAKKNKQLKTLKQTLRRREKRLHL